MRLRSANVLAQYMSFRQETVRSLAGKCGCSPATVGHLRSGKRKTAKPLLARRIEEQLQAPPGLLFEPVVSSVSSDARGAA